LIGGLIFDRLLESKWGARAILMLGAVAVLNVVLWLGGEQSYYATRDCVRTETRVTSEGDEYDACVAWRSNDKDWRIWSPIKYVVTGDP
jgi:hypothetical protein